MSLPAGMLEETEFRAETTRLRPGDVLVIHSDGLSGVRNLEGEIFGEWRMRQAAVAAAAAGCRTVLDAIERASWRSRRGRRNPTMSNGGVTLGRDAVARLMALQLLALCRRGEEAYDRAGSKHRSSPNQADLREQ